MTQGNWRRVGIGLLLAWFGGLGAVAQETNGPSRADYSAFRLIGEKNIFNANRYGRSAPPPPTEERRSTRVESFTLVGTLSYGKGPFAFFDGTSSDFRKVLPPGGLIAGHKVTEITNSQVRLELETNHYELKVGSQLRREDEGAWQFREFGETYASAGGRSEFGRSEFGRSDSRGLDPRRSDSRNDFRGFDSRRSDSRGFDPRRSDSRGPSASDASRTTPAPAVATPKLSAEEENEILKRLMQQREQETK